MGVVKPFSASHFSDSGNNKSPNPNPKRFKVLSTVQVGTAAVCEVQYLDATTYNGVKLLVYRNTTVSDIISATTLDPHFTENRDGLVPFARFEPTEDGLDFAISVAMLCNPTFHVAVD